MDARIGNQTHTISELPVQARYQDAPGHPVQQMQANGVRLRASLDTCGQLRATASTAQAPQMAARTPIHSDALQKAVQPEIRRDVSTAPRIAPPGFSDAGARLSVSGLGSFGFHIVAA